jgi:hypothetical protein
MGQTARSGGVRRNNSVSFVALRGAYMNDPNRVTDPPSPVREEQPAAPAAVLRPGPTLCLSGGGYRAMLFHTGVLWRLNELRYFRPLDRMSSVSGASPTLATVRQPVRPQVGRLLSAGLRRRLA